ncbi:NAD(P)H-binding protein [Cellulomonas sp. APG4]|uniref:NmrA family NAD(P)-binding protein n=1 Tax=Cellulomonas sp. APG4 TaxID=1538656 RepID=UPI0013795AAB|nr:NmrA family NAD(P)-binding protein [Cellulomonas sp. APG4]NCT92368.1 NAD(P)H-binding protein [Cellulomonas sp. APG4]
MTSTSTSTHPAQPTAAPGPALDAVGHEVGGPVHVICGTGKTGRRVAERLEALGVPVANRSRRSTPAFDWQDRSTWAAAVEGAAALYVTYVPDLAVDGSDDDVAHLAALAREAGVGHVVLLSGRGEVGARRAELALEASGVAWTVVRASWFHQNFTEGALLDGVRSGVVALPAGDVAEPFVDADDIADVAVAALLDPALRGRVHEVTGPRALTFAEVAGEISAVLGREVVYVPMEPEPFRAAVAEQAGEEYARMLTDLCVEVFDGRNVEPTDGVRAALGREPRDLADYVRANAAAWR